MANARPKQVRPKHTRPKRRAGPQPNTGFHRNTTPHTSWEPVAHWYRRWVGKRGNPYHRKCAIPAVLALLSLQPGEHILDLGAGTGALAPHIHRRRCEYTGIDASRTLVHTARRYHGHCGRFLVGDARRLWELPQLQAEMFDAAVFLLSIQDMEPLSEVLKSTCWTLKVGGCVVVLMTHPCFRIPGLSGWEWDRSRHLCYRRVDRYLTATSIRMPIQDGGATTSFHRPLSAYVNGLAQCGLSVEQIREIPGLREQERLPESGNHAHEEIPLFLRIRAVKSVLNERVDG